MDSSNFHVFFHIGGRNRVSIWSDECGSGFFILGNVQLAKSTVNAKHGIELTAEQFMKWMKEMGLNIQDILQALREINGRS